MSSMNLLRLAELSLDGSLGYPNECSTLINLFKSKFNQDNHNLFQCQTLISFIWLFQEFKKFRSHYVSSKTCRRNDKGKDQIISVETLYWRDRQKLSDLSIRKKREPLPASWVAGLSFCK
jgi:hypothetical protein